MAMNAAASGAFGRASPPPTDAGRAERIAAALREGGEPTPEFVASRFDDRSTVFLGLHRRIPQNLLLLEALIEALSPVLYECGVR